MIEKTKDYFSVFLYCLFFSTMLSGCGGSSGMEDSVTQPDSKPLSPVQNDRVDAKKIKDLDDEIDFTKKTIRGYQRHLTRTLQNAVIYRAKDQAARGWYRGDGGEEDGARAERETMEANATELEIARLQRKLKKLELKKKRLLQQSSGCFPPETLVKMENGSLKTLEDLRQGEKVMTYDIGDESPVSKAIVEIYAVDANHLYTINGQLMTTGGERLLSQNGWETIRNLKKGDLVHINGQMIKIESIDYSLVRHKLLNIQVADTHNFYVVTEDGSRFLVHNTSGKGGGSK